MTDLPPALPPEETPAPATPSLGARIGARLKRIALAYVHEGALGAAGLVLLGLLLNWMALPPGPFAPMVLVADVPFLLLIWRAGGQRWKRWAWLYGMLHFAVAMRWLVHVHPAQVVTSMIILGPVYLLLGGAIRWCVAARIPYVLAVGTCVVFEELVRTFWMGGMPWPARSLSFAADGLLDPLLPAASLVGAYGLSFLAGTTAAVLSGVPRCFTAAPEDRPLLRRRVMTAALVPVIVAITLGVAAYTRTGGFDDAQRAGGAWQTFEKLVVVQGNIPQGDKHVPGMAEQNFTKHTDITREAVKVVGETDVFGVLWPETMLPWPLVSPGLAARFPDQWSSYVNVVTRIKARVPEAKRATWLIGAIHLFERPGDPRFGSLFQHGTHDSMFQIEPEYAPDPGDPLPRPEPEDPDWFPPWERARHDKVVLVPGGEYTPLGGAFPVLRKLRNFVSVIPELDAGDPDQRPMNLWEGDKWSMQDRRSRVRTLKGGTVVCFELAFPARCRAWRAAGADVLINTANYGWFGKTGFRSQIHAIARLRAAELAASVVMAGNTGPTAFYDPLGRRYGTFHPAGGGATRPAGIDATTHQGGWVAEKVWVDRSKTPYSVVGDLPWWILGGLLLLRCLQVTWRRRRAASAG